MGSVSAFVAPPWRALQAQAAGEPPAPGAKVFTENVKCASLGLIY